MTDGPLSGVTVKSKTGAVAGIGAGAAKKVAGGKGTSEGRRQ